MADKPKVVKTEKQVLKEFFIEYQALCKKHQAQIIANPAFKKRDDSTFSVVLEVGVGRLPKKRQ